jgi:uncharacterized protein
MKAAHLTQDGIGPRTIPLLRPIMLLVIGAATISCSAPEPRSATTFDIGGGTRVHVPVTSLHERQYRGLIRQAFDYSCGAAALATLLTYGVGDRVSEREIMQQLFALLPKDQEALREKEGFSLLDLQHVAQARGHKAQGFRLTPEFLPKLKGPVIVFIRPRGYEHFAVLKGVRGNYVYLADPSRGNMRQVTYRFMETWLDERGEGIIFVVEGGNGLLQGPSPLRVKARDLPPPELLSARQMLEMGNPYTRFPELLR